MKLLPIRVTPLFNMAHHIKNRKDRKEITVEKLNTVKDTYRTTRNNKSVKAKRCNKSTMEEVNQHGY